jgi:hypothetical protein
MSGSPEGFGAQPGMVPQSISDPYIETYTRITLKQNNPGQPPQEIVMDVFL